MMKKLSFFFCLLLLSCSQEEKVIKVQYTPSSGVELLSSSFFDEIELVTLSGEGAPFLGWGLSTPMIVKDDEYYIASGDQIHRYDATGKYLNSVGQKGRGPGEYVDISNMIVEENGDISIYSWGTLYTYSPQGRFLRSIEYVHKSFQLGRANGFNYHFYGHRGGKPYQLYITDNYNNTIDSCFIAANVISMFFSPVFSSFENNLYLCYTYGGEIYRLRNGKVDLLYNFDFGVYAFPAEYFNKNYEESISFIMSQSSALKSRFFENHKYAILQALVTDNSLEQERSIYGILEKTTLVWRWYYMNQGDFMNGYHLRYMDDSYVYFTADPVTMKETGLADRFPVLNTLGEDADVVIIKCNLKK